MGSLGDSLLSQPILSPLTSLVLEQCWASIPIDTLLPPLAEIPTYADYMAAFAVRNNFAELFESHPPHPPFFNPVFDQHTRRQRDHYYRFLEQLGKIHEQNKGQALSLAACNGSPVPSQRPKYINSLVGDPGSQRPFCKVSWAVSRHSHVPADRPNTASCLPRGECHDCQLLVKRRAEHGQRVSYAGALQRHRLPWHQTRSVGKARPFAPSSSRLGCSLVDDGEASSFSPSSQPSHLK